MNRYTVTMNNYSTIDIYADYTEIFRDYHFHCENLRFCRYEGRYPGENVAIISMSDIKKVKFEKVYW